MRDIKFRVWHRHEKKIYFRGYQKLTHVLLCNDDQGANNGKGTPVKKANYEDCEFFECTDVLDLNGVPIYEGDLVRVMTDSIEYEGVVGAVPDMFKSRNLHPMDSLLQRYDVDPEDPSLKFEVLGQEVLLLLKRELHTVDKR